jgi:hypothetical protein
VHLPVIADYLTPHSEFLIVVSGFGASMGAFPARCELTVFETSYLLLSLVFSSIGLGYFIYGKKQHHKTVYYAGIGLMVFPYVVTDRTSMILIGVLLMGLPGLLKKLDLGE